LLVGRGAGGKEQCKLRHADPRKAYAERAENANKFDSRMQGAYREPATRPASSDQEQHGDHRHADHGTDNQGRARRGLRYE
jgi:hypothetical protein